MKKSDIDKMREKYEYQNGVANKTSFIHYTDYTDYGDLYSDYSEDTTTYEDIDPNEN